MIARLKVFGVMAVVGIVLFLSGMQVGIYKQQASDKQGVIDQQRSDAGAIMGIDEKAKVAEEKRNVIIRAVIRKARDPTGCLDTPSPNPYVDGMRRIYEGR